MGLWNKTGNQIVEKRNDFLKDLAIYGTTVTYIVRKSTGVFDPITDKHTGTGHTEVAKVFEKAMLLVPIRADNNDGVLDNTNATSMSVGFAAGYKFEGVDLRVHIFAKVRPDVPLAPSAIYEIDRVRYKIKEVLHNQAFGHRLPLWNVVRFEKA